MHLQFNYKILGQRGVMTDFKGLDWHIVVLNAKEIIKIW